MHGMVKLVLLLVCLSLASAAFPMCPDGQVPRHCPNPCRSATCYGFRGAHCRPNYCGCYPMFFDNNGRQLDCQNRWYNRRFNYHNRYD
ncbi:Hypothetical predicted protein [Octopus vulgaris]|uniref:Secreted protein n=1 Tax=Octopus vulgaris TaxID=6645 RepID=A0AA36BRV1_OCTVU|nr:Hypothetical predicted protein [Octopus vulgaris]